LVLRTIPFDQRKSLKLNSWRCSEIETSEFLLLQSA